MIQLRLLFTEQCAGCERASLAVENLRQEFPELQVEHVNLLDHPEEALRYGLLATPGVVINGTLEFAGGVKEKELRRKLEHLSNQGGSHA